MTPTEQRPQECKHFSKRGFFAWFLTHLHKCDGASGYDSCIYESHQHACPDFTPETEK